MSASFNVFPFKNGSTILAVTAKLKRHRLWEMRTLTKNSKFIFVFLKTQHN